MKRDLIKGIILIGAVALSSCSVNKTASTSKNDDDVYFSHASAAEEPVYITRNEEYNQEANDQYSDEDDYFYYDDYASRINRFSYYSPFGYYDAGYYGYGYGSPYFGGGWGWGGVNPYYYGGYGYNFGIGYGLGGWGLGIGYGWGGYGYPWGYSPWGYGGYYSPYSYWGTGIGYGGGYWGVYSAYNRGNARPYRGNGSPGSSYGNTHRTAYGDRNTGIGYIPNRGSRGGNGGQTSGRPVYGDTRATRGVRNDVPTYQPSVDRSSPSSNSSGGGRSSGGGSSSGSSGGGGGGGRPVRN